MKIVDIVVHMGNYNFTKFHQNQMKNKKVLLTARFSVQNFKVSLKSWKSYIVRTAGNIILVWISVGLDVLFFFCDEKRCQGNPRNSNRDKISVPCDRRKEKCKLMHPNILHWNFYEESWFEAYLYRVKRVWKNK